MKVSGKLINNMVKELKLGMKVKVFTKVNSYRAVRRERLAMNPTEMSMKVISWTVNSMEKENTISSIQERRMKDNLKTMKCMVKER